MQKLGDIDVHFWLTRSVARTVGVNLSEAMAARRLSPEDYSAMVTRCREADCATRCAEWLGEQENGRAPRPPAFCAHADQLRALRLN